MPRPKKTSTKTKTPTTRKRRRRRNTSKKKLFSIDYFLTLLYKQGVHLVSDFGSSALNRGIQKLVKNPTLANVLTGLGVQIGGDFAGNMLPAKAKPYMEVVSSLGRQRFSEGIFRLVSKIDKNVAEIHPDGVTAEEWLKMLIPIEGEATGGAVRTVHGNKLLQGMNDPAELLTPKTMEQARIGDVFQRDLNVQETKDGYAIPGVLSMREGSTKVRPDKDFALKIADSLAKSNPELLVELINAENSKQNSGYFGEASTSKNKKESAFLNTPVKRLYGDSNGNQLANVEDLF